MTAARDFNTEPRRVCCELRKILALPARRAGRNRHILLLQQHRPGLRATTRASSRLNAESVREGRKKSSLPLFIPHARPCIRPNRRAADHGRLHRRCERRERVPGDGSHTHTCGQSPRPNRSETIRPAGYQSIYLWAEGHGPWSRDAGRVWHLCSRRADGVNVRKRCEKGGGGKGAVALQAKRKGEVDTDALKGDYERGGVRPVSICR